MIPAKDPEVGDHLSGDVLGPPEALWSASENALGPMWAFVGPHGSQHYRVGR